MAYRTEKEQNGKDCIVIDGWGEGISSDPYSGMGVMKQVDLETPGEVSVGYGITSSTVSGATMTIPCARSTRFFPTYATSTGTPTGAAFSYAIMDGSGHVFESSTISGTFTFLSSSNSTVGSTTNDGMVYWLGYLWKTRGSNLDYWDGSTWHTGWQTSLADSASVPHFMYVATDNILYIGNGNYLAALSAFNSTQNALNPDTFDPTNPLTYAFSTTKLRVPVTDIVVSLAEVGGGNTPQTTLLIGGAQNAIYPWDKLSSSFGVPIYVADAYITRMVSANQNAFIFPGSYPSGSGSRGRIYITNGAQADLYYKIPDYIFGQQDPYYLWGDAIYHRNNIIFGFVPLQNSNGSTAITGTSEVWALSLSSHTTASGIVMPEKTFRSISTIPLGGQTFTNANTLIAAVNPTTAGFSYIVGWRSGSTGGAIGYTGTAAGTGTFSLNTDLMEIGSFLQKRTFTQLEYKLRSPLEAGESISVTPIADTVTGSALTFSPTPTVGSISGVAPVNFEKNQWLQFTVAGTGNSATSGCRLKELRLR